MLIKFRLFNNTLHYVEWSLKIGWKETPLTGRSEKKHDDTIGKNSETKTKKQL